MTVDEFDEKYAEYLEDGHYGLAINDPKVIEYLDEQFPLIIKHNGQPFKYSQIKTKFGNVCVYCNAQPAIVRGLELEINKILNGD